LVPLYQDEYLFVAMHRLLSERCYTLADLEPGFADRQSGWLLQVDGTYHRLPVARRPDSVADLVARRKRQPQESAR
jgi:hypothetical protein